MRYINYFVICGLSIILHQRNHAQIIYAIDLGVEIKNRKYYYTNNNNLIWWHCHRVASYKM